MISAVILTWNSEDHIGNCLDSLLSTRLNNKNEIQILVVDGNSQDSTRNILDRYESKNRNVSSIRLEENKGTTVSRNLGIKGSEGEYILFLDSDTVVNSGAIEGLREDLEENPSIGLMAPKLLYPDGRVQRSCKKFPTVPIKVSKFVPLNVFRDWAERSELYDNWVYEGDGTGVIDVDHCISAAWLVRREALNEVGKLDEHIFYAPEDVDMCLRMWLGGWRVSYNPEVSIIHDTQRISYSNISFTLEHAKGLIYYFKKHGYWFSREKIYTELEEMNEYFHR